MNGVATLFRRLNSMGIFDQAEEAGIPFCISIPGNPKFYFLIRTLNENWLSA